MFIEGYHVAHTVPDVSANHSIGLEAEIVTPILAWGMHCISLVCVCLVVGTKIHTVGAQ